LFGIEKVFFEIFLTSSLRFRGASGSQDQKLNLLSIVQQKNFPGFRQDDDDVKLPVLETLILIFDFLQFRLKSL